MKSLSLFLFLISFAILAYKPLPPGAGTAVKPNVLFVIDTSGSMRGSRIASTKAALIQLMDDTAISSSIRLGLTRFPNQNPANMLVVPINDSTNIVPGNTHKTHVEIMKDEISALPASGGTPLESAIDKSRKYFLGNGGTDVCKPVAYTYYGSNACQTPIIDKCQKNYVILFTDGQPNGTLNNVSDAAYDCYNHGLTGATDINGNALVDTRLLVYAIAFGGATNVDYIASGTSNTGTVYNPAGGGTEKGYDASNTTELKAQFDKIITDIGAKNITATSPTLIPGFAGPENDVMYLTNFQPREDKQWTGHLYKYKLTTSGTNVLDGAPVWDLHTTLLAKNIDNRKVFTICRDINAATSNADPVTDFTLDNSVAIAFCMLQRATGGAGNAMLSKIETPQNWQSPNPIPADCNEHTTCKNGDSNCWTTIPNGGGCTPRRQWNDPTCVGSENIVDMIDNEYATYQNICYFEDFDDYALGQSLPPGFTFDCSPVDTSINIPGYGTYTITKRDKARAIQRYLCQHNNTFCGCFERWEGVVNGQPSNGKSLACINPVTHLEDNTICGGVNSTIRDPDKASCYNGYCVGPTIDYDNVSIWNPGEDGVYDNNLNNTITIQGNNSDKTGKIELTLKNLDFDSSTNGNVVTNGSIADYLVIEETRNAGGNVSHVITTRKDENGNDKRYIYSCYLGENISGVNSVSAINIPSSCLKSEIAKDVVLNFPMLSPAQVILGEDFKTRKLKLTFRSDAAGNDLAFILASYNFKPENIVTQRWAFSGEENEAPNRDGFEKDDIKLTARLIDFVRGKDSFQEDTATECKYKDDGKRDGSCDDRKYPLADIYNSRVKFVGTPSQMYTYAGYRVFQSQNIKTVAQSLLIFGANDGLLHAVNPDDGSGDEQWAFVPPTLLARLKTMVVNDDYDKTVSQFFADASVKVMDVCNGVDCDSDATNWKRVLVMGFGEAQEALMALDITKLDEPKFMWAFLNETPSIFKSPVFNDLTNCKKLKRVLRWDEYGNIYAYSNLAAELESSDDLAHDRSDHMKKTDNVLANYPEYDYSLLARTWSEPVIAQLAGTNDATGKFVAVVGAGGNYPKNDKNPNETTSDDNNSCIDYDRIYGSSVYMIDLFDNGKILTRYDLPKNTNNIPQRVPATVSILPKPQQFDISGIQNRIMAQIYTADMSGRIWRMTVDDSLVDQSATGAVVTCDDGNSNNKVCLKLYDNKSTEANKNYFFKSVAITYDGKTSNMGNTDSNDDTSIWVYGGTGDVSLDGIKNNSGNNILMAVKDRHWELDSSNKGKSIDGVGVTVDNLRLITTSNEDPLKCSKDSYKTESGWKFYLPANFKLVGEPVIVDGYVYFTVYDHGEDTVGSSECSGHLGESWLYSFKLFSACHNSAFDKMGDGSDNTDSNKLRAKLGKGIATSPVLRGNTMYFGISGEADSADGDPILGQGQRDGNIIRWDRPNGDEANTDKSTNVPFAYFREVY
jgi:hypothetical protein